MGWRRDEGAGRGRGEKVRIGGRCNGTGRERRDAGKTGDEMEKRGRGRRGVESERKE